MAAALAVFEAFVILLFISLIGLGVTLNFPQLTRLVPIWIAAPFVGLGLLEGAKWGIGRRAPWLNGRRGIDFEVGHQLRVRSMGVNRTWGWLVTSDGEDGYHSFSFSTIRYLGEAGSKLMQFAD